MTRIMTFLALLIASLLSAQNDYKADMQHALSLWEDGKTAVAVKEFEAIATVYTSEWLPNYYVALLTAQEALMEGDNRELMKSLLEKAQRYQDLVNRVELENAEVLVVQALINTGWIIYNPIINGPKLSADVAYLYKKANEVSPENPRVHLNKTNYEIGVAKYFGQDTSGLCEQYNKTLTLFANFKPKSEIEPNWGFNQARALLAECIK
ncbi:hypothetical protein ACFS5J_12850 [Flavobacterium chuncheonense]|uniref:Tetratricopeptide repeat protein n=1 Tax=Flavobacterium chuncheonense TaxID=2026653 RepID=A0ABW5YQB7_9FLAO